MPIRVGWYIKDRVMFTETWGHLTKNEYIQSVLATVEKFETTAGDYPIHVIVDQTRMITQPNLQDLTSEQGVNKRQGWILVIMQDNPAQKFQTSVTAQKFKFETRFVQSRQEAQNIIETTVTELKGQFSQVEDVEWFFELDESSMPH